MRLLREFYRRDASAGFGYKALATVHALADVAIGRALPAGAARDGLRGAIDLPWLTFTTRLRDGIALAHRLEDYGVLAEIVRDDVYGLAALPPGGIVVDVGANFGSVSVLCEKRFAAARVVAFEPCPANLRLLRRNVAANGCTRITVDGRAVAADSGRRTLFLHRAATHSLRRRSSREHVVDTVALDEVLAGEPAIDLLKIDVEGAEAEVLRGAAAVLRRTQRVAVEAHDDVEPDRGEVLAMLRAAGFTLRVQPPYVLAHRRRQPPAN